MCGSWQKVPGKISGLVNKAFGNNCYAHKMSVYPGIEYQNISLEDSIIYTEAITDDSKKKMDDEK